MTDVGEWLTGLGFPQYVETFAANAIGADVLADLSDVDLEKLGIPLGDRKRLLKAIAARCEGNKQPAETPWSPSAEQAQRRQLTVMFVDLIGSTALSGRLDPEEMREVIRSYQNAVAGEIARLDGHTAKFMGDGVLAYFGWPKAHEDEAERAVRAGLAITAAVAKLATPAEEPLSTRIGIATGLVVVGDLVGEGAAQEVAVIGETPNLAARLQSLAGPGSVVVAGSTRRLLGERFEMFDLGVYDLKGFASPMQAWQVVRESQLESRFEALRGTRLIPLVGRQEELALLLDCWRQAKDGRGRVVVLAGEPGIGKSRIAVALREQLRGDECLSLRYQGSPYHTNSALFPILDQLQRAAGFKDEDKSEERFAKLEALLATAMPDSKLAIPLIAEHLAIPIGTRYSLPEFGPEQKKAKTFQALLAQLEGLAVRQPVLMTAEDAHWFDPTSLELFDLVVDLIQGLPVLLVVTCRPEFAPRWTDRPHVTMFTLNRLGRDEGDALISQICGGRLLPPEVQAHIIAKTEGMPLFVEELTKVILESGLLREVGQRYELSGSLPPLAIPSTLEDSLLARLDRSTPIKEVAQIGAVIGREFSHALLVAAAEMDEPKLRAALDELVRSELAFCHGTPPNAIYTFKHALVRDAAYQSLLKSRRQQLHSRIASVLHERFPERSEAEPEVLAYHATEAGLIDLAVSYWYKAGLRANYRSGTTEAISHLSKGLDLIARLPETPARAAREIDLLTALAIPLSATKGRGSAETMGAYARAHELCTRVGADMSRLFPALRGLYTGYRGQGQMRTARALADELLAIAQGSGDQSLMLEAYHVQWNAHYALGEWRSVYEHATQGLAVYRPEHFSHAFIYSGHDSAVCAMTKQAVSSWMLGFPDRALAHAEDAVALARKLSHSPSIVHALWASTIVHHLRRELDSVQDITQQILEIAHDQLLSWIPFAKLMMAFNSALAGKQQARASINAVREALATGQSDDVESNGLFLGLFARVCALADETDVGLKALEPEIMAAAATGARIWEAELHRIAGDLLFDSAPERSESHYLRAIETAQDQHALSLNLRASTSLARLWASSSKPQQAYELLSPIYAGFMEGLDTLDLIEAKVLLEVLA